MPRQNAGPVRDGDLLWEPSAERMAGSNISRYMAWLAAERGLPFDGYDDMWKWSVDDLEGFWASIWDYFDVVSGSAYERVLGDSEMPGARWFPGATLNYAEHSLRRMDGHAALVAGSESGQVSTVSYRELRERVGAVAAGLRRLGVGRGDRVVALMPNVPETVVAFLAVSSLGAIWSACSPEFGVTSIVDRFRQIEPKVLLAVDGYRYGGRAFPRLDAVVEIQAQLQGLERTVLFPYLSDAPEMDGLESTMLWGELESDPDEVTFERVPFDHPLWVLYSSGTTGLPKPIVQGHGGILLEHLKVLSLHIEIGEGDRFFWFTTTGWMMWNFLVGGLLHGATAVLYDGDPSYPDMNALWRFAEEAGVTYFGTAAPFIYACMKAGVEPGRDFDTSKIKSVGSTGSPLSPEGFEWVYDKVGGDLLLGSFSGGTDLCTGFVGSCDLLPVYAGEIQCLCLGAKVEAFDEDGQSVVDEVGEMVITQPMPSMPIYFWNDVGRRRYHESYFDLYPGVWRHGDWVRVTERGTCVIYGRSDSTLNRGGVRMGTSEFYRVVEGMDEVLDSLVVDTGGIEGGGRLLLFVVLRGGAELDDGLRTAIVRRLRAQLSPRHAPDEIYSIESVPKTLNNKKLEVPAKRILSGESPAQVISTDAMSNPEALDFFVGLGQPDG